MPARWLPWRVLGLGRGARRALGARDPLLHRRGRADAALCARQVHAGVPPDLRHSCRAWRCSAARRTRPSCSCALLAIVAGYLVHRWLTGTSRRRAAGSARREMSLAVALVAHRDRACAAGSARCTAPRCRSCGAVGFAAGAIAALALARRLAARSAAGGGRGAGRLQRRRSRLEQRAERVDRPAAVALSRRCVRTPTDETVALLKSKLKAAAAPDRRDRVELIGVAYHWPNIGLVHGFDHLFGHNPLRLMDFRERHRRADTVAARRAAAVHAAAAVLPLDAGESVRRALHRDRRADRADRSSRSSRAISTSSRAPRTPTSTRIRARCRA